MHSGRGASCLSSVRRVSVACVPQLAAKCPSAAACPLTAVAGPNAPICTPPYSPSHPPHLRPPMCPTLLWLSFTLKAPCPSAPMHSPLIPVVKYALAYQASLIQSSNVKSAELQKGAREGEAVSEVGGAKRDAHFVCVRAVKSSAVYNKKIGKRPQSVGSPQGYGSPIRCFQCRWILNCNMLHWPHPDPLLQNRFSGCSDTPNPELNRCLTVPPTNHGRSP